MRGTRAPMPASISAMPVLTLILTQALGVLEVEDPIPEKIGLGDLFSLAGAGSVLGGLLGMGKPPAKQEQAIRMGALAGFCAGVAIYALALLVQVTSQL